MSEMPSAFKTETRVARKHHLCCECEIIISVGDRYQYSSGIWDGEPADYKQCINCSELMVSATKSSESPYDSPCFGGLYEWFEEHIIISCNGREWLHYMADKINVEPEKLSCLLRIRIKR